MNYCPKCGKQLQAGAAFCSSCGASTVAHDQQLTAQQGLAQAGLEVQTFNLLLVAGRVIGLMVAMALLWFVIGPALGPENPLGVIVALFALAIGGILVGQWVTLKLLRG